MMSREPSKESIEQLSRKLEKKLRDRQARRTGICDVRMDIYDEAFNELIRQVTINCPERGILLSKVRDEMKITVSAYKSLYESSVTFGMRKQVQAEEGMDDMKKRIEELERKKKILQNQVNFVN
jgi:dynein light intermediate chain